MGQLYSHLVFRPPAIPTYDSTDELRYTTPDASGVPTVHTAPLIWLQTAHRSKIPCAWTRAATTPSDYVILYAHQNGEDLGTSIADAHLLSAGLNIDVFSFEYTGYGLSERPRRSSPSPSTAQPVRPSAARADRTRAEPSERACCADIDAAYAYLTVQCAISPAKIIVFGRSIGSGPAVHISSSTHVGGLVLIAPIASAVRVAMKRLNVTIPFIDTFPNIDRASKIRCPVLVVHGDMDELVPKLHGEKLFEKIRANGHAVQPLWIPTAMHNNVVEDFHSIVFKRYISFLDELKALKTESNSLERDRVRRRHRSARSSRKPRKLAQTCLRPPRISVDDISIRDSIGEPPQQQQQQQNSRRKNPSCIPLPLRDQPWRRVSSVGNMSTRRSSEAVCPLQHCPRISRGDNPIWQNFCVHECSGKCDGDGDCAAEDDPYVGFVRLESFSSDDDTYVDNPRRWQVLVPPHRSFGTSIRSSS